MVNLNKVMIMGRLTKDVESVELENGSKVSKFSIATNRYYKDKTSGEKKQITSYINAECWGQQGETINQYFNSGDEIYVEGEICTQSWEKDGQKYYKTFVNVFSFQFGAKAKPKAEQSEPAPEKKEEPKSDMEEKTVVPNDNDDNNEEKFL